MLATRSTCKGYRGGNSDAYFAYTISCGRQPMNKPVAHRSQTGQEAIHRPRRDGWLADLGGESEPRTGVHATPPISLTRLIH